MKALIVAAAALAVVNGSARAESGVASLYSTRELGTKTASGRHLHDGALTAAHKTLPFGSRVRVTNHANGHSVVVTITDRGPFSRGRVIDLTPAGGRVLGFSGLARVTLERSAINLRLFSDGACPRNPQRSMWTAAVISLFPKPAC